MSLLVRNQSTSLPSVFNDFFGQDWMGGSSMKNGIMPAVNISENDDAFELEMSVAGLTREDVNIEVDNDVLMISSEKKSENNEDKKNYSRREFSSHSFKSHFHLPDSTDQNKIEASLENGVLTITLPKKEEAKPQPKRSIELK